MIQIRKKEDKKKPALKKNNHLEIFKHPELETVFTFDEDFKIVTEKIKKLEKREIEDERIFEEPKIAKSALMEICENDINHVFMKKHYQSPKLKLKEQKLELKIQKNLVKTDSTLKKNFEKKKTEKTEEKLIEKNEIVIRKKNIKKKQNEIKEKSPKKTQLDKISVSTCDEPKTITNNLPGLIPEDLSETVVIVDKSDMGSLMSSDLPDNKRRDRRSGRTGRSKHSR